MNKQTVAKRKYTATKEEIAGRTAILQVENVQFDANTGDRLSKDYILRLNEYAYAQFLDQIGVTGLTIHHVLHLPEGVKTPKEFFEAKQEKEQKLLEERIKVNKS